MSKGKSISEHASTCQMILVSDLNVDPEAQRALTPGWVKAHVAIFDADQLGYIVVNKRSNGKYYVVDGQHRVDLMRQVGWGDQMVHCELFEGLTQAEEAELFLARNDRKSVTPFDKFRVAVTAGDPVCVDIQKIVTEHGMAISSYGQDGHITAVQSLRKVYMGGGIKAQKEGPKALANTLKVIVQAWGKSPSSISGQIIQGIGLVHLRYDGKIDQKAMINKLAPIRGGAPGMLGRGKAMQELRGRPLHHCIASIVVDIYNKGRRTEKLEAWES